jgi:hypothetical protein
LTSFLCHSYIIDVTDSNASHVAGQYIFTMLVESGQNVWASD